MKLIAKINLLLGLFLVGCGSSGGGDSTSDAPKDIVPGSVTTKGATLCGVMDDGGYVNPPVYSEKTSITIEQVIDSNLVEIVAGGQKKLVKLHGLGNTSGFENTAAAKLYDSITSGQQLFYIKAGDCQVTTTVGTAEVGQIVTEDGLSLSEQALNNHIAGVIEKTGECNESVLAGCYAALSDPDDSTPSEHKQVSKFLWKPGSESPYNPGGVSILLNPCDVRVVVNGTEIREYPSGNGRCTTVRSAKAGCDFGTNVKVEVFDQATGEAVYFGSQPYLTITNGCDRTEFAGSGSSDDESEIECSTMSGNVSYQPALESCSGNAAVILRGEYQGAYSVQLRLPDGGDRLDEDCSEKSCSPYKVQQYIDGTGEKTACFGAPGEANLMTSVVHTSIKMAGDDRNPARFCIPDPKTAVN